MNQMEIKNEEIKQLKQIVELLQEENGLLKRLNTALKKIVEKSRGDNIV